MQAFKKLPGDMVRRLAADAGHVRLPAGRLVFEEDAPGHCMYVVVRGSCAVRARPLAARPLRPGGGGARGIGMGLRGGGGLKGAGERGHGAAHSVSVGRSAASGSTHGASSPGRRSELSSARESSVSRVTAAAEAEAAEKAGGGSDGEGLGVPVGGGGRGGGWGGMGFTTLLTVRAARKARERHPDAEEDLNEEHGEEGEEGQEALDGPSRKVRRAVHNLSPLSYYSSQAGRTKCIQCSRTILRS